MANSTYLSEEEVLEQFKKDFVFTASMQGRLAYLLMSIHAVNPAIWERFSDIDPTSALFVNMIYGFTVYIYSRPSMKPISMLNRFAFSILGSLMFNYSTMMVYDYIRANVEEERTTLKTFLGYIAGRLMLVHFLAFFYHVDTRSIGSTSIMRDPAYEGMYQ